MTVLAAISLLSVVPINTAILPRITNLFSEKNLEKFNSIFNTGFCLNLCIVSSITITLCLYSEEVLIIWTGNSELAHWGYSTLIVYSLGYCFISLTHTLTTYLTAIGKLKFATFSNLIWAPCLIFLFYLSGYYSNYFYAGLSWFACNLILFILIFGLITFYSKYRLDKLHLIFQVIKVILFSIIIYVLFKTILQFNFFTNRLIMLIQIAFIFSLILFSLLIILKETREILIFTLHKIKLLII